VRGRNGTRTNFAGHTHHHHACATAPPTLFPIYISVGNHVVKRARHSNAGDFNASSIAMAFETSEEFPEANSLKMQ
jgi:hypothetical protein